MSAADNLDLRSALDDDALAELGPTVPQSERRPPLEGDGTPYGVKPPGEECIATPPENDTEARQDQPQHPRDAGDDAGPPPENGTDAQRDHAAEPPPAGKKTHTHFRRSENGNTPCTPTGEEERHSDGRIYAKVRF